MAGNGRFLLSVDTGTYRITAYPLSKYNAPFPDSIIKTHAGFFLTDTVQFGLQALPRKRDLSVNLVPLRPARPGFSVVYKILYQNVGTDTVASGLVRFVKSSAITNPVFTPRPDSIYHDTITWKFTSLKSGDTSSIEIAGTLLSPPYLNIRDTVSSNAYILPDSADLDPLDNISVLRQIVVGSFDPNEITENHGGMLKPGQLQKGEALIYTIRFQNTGSDTAFNIAIKDTLDRKLDWSTLEMIAASNNYQLDIKQGNKLSWTFDKINLVDSNRNESASHGYLVYRIKPLATFVPGDTIYNSAQIYFDYNQPVPTNTEKTYFQSSVLPLTLLTFDATASGKINLLIWKTATEMNVQYFSIERSVDGRNFSAIGNVTASGTGEYSLKFTDQFPASGTNYYRLKIFNKDRTFSYSMIRSVENSGEFIVTLFPNPIKEKMNISIESDIRRSILLEIVTVDGKVINSFKTVVDAGISSRTFNISGLKAGMYFVNVTSKNEQKVIRLEKL